MKLTQATTLLLSLGLSLPVEGFSLSRTNAVGPKPPFRPLPASTPRNKTCQVQSNGDGTDDAPYILAALKQCNNGGKVVFAEDKEYTIGTALDMTFLKHVDLDTDYWQENSFKHTFQNATTFFNLGGTDVNVYGGGELNGNGQVWYDLYAEDALILRPILVGIIGLHGGTIGPLKLRYSPQWYQLVANSSDVLFDGIDISGSSSRTSTATVPTVSPWAHWANTKAKSTSCRTSSSTTSPCTMPLYVPIQTPHISQTIQSTNKRKKDMARIKVWPGISSAMSEDLQGGGGLGSVQNITYDKMYIENVDWAIEVTQCYGQKNQTLCNENPVWFYFSIQLFIGEMLFGIVYGIYGLADLVWNRATLRLAMSTSMISPVSHLERMIRMWERLFVRVLM
ncbi:unnamed protein product [Aspergillus oryzae]|nr:unnamed protein product [Aspergillus oryzae]